MTVHGGADGANLSTVGGRHDAKVPTRAPDVAWVLVDGEVVAFEPQGPAVYLLSSTGGLIWQCFDGTTSVSDLATDLAEVFVIPLDEAVRGVEAFMLEMVGFRLLAVDGIEVGGHEYRA